ncbi:hypothetical protein EVAR_19995_1 [Eumeta japonica]|uniref:Uncharacterized protein n=1 Tax=Eumeta variegata TaxID=151549 RepID=A0A4C1VCZ1_EUMVA|nr:hypothetical protein EVAR_19995_1 [Eumeta japonica]
MGAVKTDRGAERPPGRLVLIYEEKFDGGEKKAVRENRSSETIASGAVCERASFKTVWKKFYLQKVRHESSASRCIAEWTHLFYDNKDIAGVPGRWAVLYRRCNGIPSGGVGRRGVRGAKGGTVWAVPPPRPYAPRAARRRPPAQTRVRPSRSRRRSRR